MGPGINHNVKLALWWSLFENISGSVRSGDVLSALLFLLTGSNTTVGVVQGINGVLQLVTALPAGYCADKYRRDSILRAGAAVGALAAVVLALALAWRPTVWMLGAAMAMLGCYRGIYSAAMEAIFADSIQAGRSSLYTKKYAVTVLASSFGPWLSLVLFHRLGNRWHADDCRLVLLSGVVLMVIPLIQMCFFDDDRALLLPHASDNHPQDQQDSRQQYTALPASDGSCGRDSNGSRHTAGCGCAAASEPSAPTVAAAGQGSDTRANGRVDVAVTAAAAALAPTGASPPEAAGNEANQEVHVDPQGPIEQDSDADAEEAAEAACSSSCCAGLAPGLVVTVLVTVSDFIGALASGMTLKFFALFFMQAVKMGPMAVSLIGALSPLGVSAASLACQPLSKFVGRVQISLFTRALDIVLLVALAYLPTATPSAQRLLVVVHLARMAVANCTRPLMRSVLMDFVPRHHRGKVNAVDSIRTFSWSGSAAAGGWLIERYGFNKTFLITASIKTAAFVPLFFLLAYVPDGMCIPPGTRTRRLHQQQQWQRQSAAVPAVASLPTLSAEPGSASHSLKQPLISAESGT